MYPELLKSFFGTKGASYMQVITVCGISVITYFVQRHHRVNLSAEATGER